MHALEAVHEVGLEVHRFLQQSQIVHAAGNFTGDRLQHHPGLVHADTEVGPRAEGSVVATDLLVAAGDIEAVRVVEVGFITAG